MIKTTSEKKAFEKCYGYTEKAETKEQKATREKFTTKHGYARHDETASQKVNRLMTSRLEKFVKSADALETLSRSPYKATDKQREYCVEMVEKASAKVVNSMQGSSDSEGPKIEVPTE